jgi:hypothetical protein
MIHLYQIATDHFILLHTEQSVFQALAAVRKLQPTAVVVRHQTGEAVSYYLFTVTELLTMLDEIKDEKSLLDALNLHARQTVPSFDAYSDAESAPSRCVVTDSDLVVGIYDASLHPTSTVIQRGEKEATTKSATVSRALQADFPEQVPLGQTVSLLVSLIGQAGLMPALPLAVPIGTVLDVVVQPQSGFILVGHGESQITVTDEEETLPIQFKLSATSIGPGRIRILCFQAGQPLGALTLTPTVVSADFHAETQRYNVSRPLAQLTAPQSPDLTLLILEHETQGLPAITLRLTAMEPTLGLNLKPFGPIRLRVNPLQYFQDFFKEIEGLPLRTANEQSMAVRKLELKGARLFEDLLPEDLRVLLWSLRERIQTVQVLSDEPWIPWELLKLSGREDGRVIEGPFLCEAYALTRWLPGIGRQPTLSLRQMALAVPSDSGLPNAQNERAHLLSLANAQHQVNEIPATWLDMVEALSLGKYDGWHFTGHGRFDTSDPNRSAILLEQGMKLCAEEITGKVSNCGMPHPLVFLNACQTGREALSLTGIGGWAQSFIQAGAAGFIGSLWSVYDEAAFQFSQVFYSHLLAGEPIGQAVKSARAATRPLNNPTWLAYTVYADPLAKIER